MFGMPAEDDGTRTDPLLFQNIISCTHYEPDFDALRAASTRIVLGAGVESDGEMAHRGAEAVAERLGTEPVVFPSGHGGFLGGEYGQPGASRMRSRRSCARSSPRPSRGGHGGLVSRPPLPGVDDEVEPAPQDHDEQRRADEPEPERRRDPEALASRPPIGAPMTRPPTIATR